VTAFVFEDRFEGLQQMWITPV